MPYHPTGKASIEAHQRYIRSSFFAGRSWPSLAVMTQDALTWFEQVAGQRRPRALEGRTVAEVFTAEEAPALGPLPDAPSGPATWSRAKAAADADVIAGRTLYSVPYRLIGKHLDVRVTPALAEFYLDGELGRTHPFQPRGRRTDWEDLPGNRTGFFMRTPHWCQSQALLAGPACAALVEDLLSVNALFRLRQAQGVLRLGDRHGDARLEAACARARSRRPVLPHRQGHPGRRDRARLDPAAPAPLRRARLAARPGRVRRRRAVTAAGTTAGLTPVLKALGLSGMLGTMEARLAEARDYQGPRHQQHLPRLVPPHGPGPQAAVHHLPDHHPQPAHHHRLGQTPGTQRPPRHRRTPTQNPPPAPQNPRQPCHNTAVTRTRHPSPPRTRPPGSVSMPGNRQQEHTATSQARNVRRGEHRKHDRNVRPGCEDHTRPKREQGPHRNVKTLAGGAGGARTHDRRIMRSPA
jgi:hypothetical protein